MMSDPISSKPPLVQLIILPFSSVVAVRVSLEVYCVPLIPTLMAVRPPQLPLIPPGSVNRECNKVIEAAGQVKALPIHNVNTPPSTVH